MNSLVTGQLQYNVQAWRENCIHNDHDDIGYSLDRKFRMPYFLSTFCSAFSRSLAIYIEPNGRTRKMLSHQSEQRYCIQPQYSLKTPKLQNKWKRYKFAPFADLSNYCSTSITYEDANWSKTRARK